MNKIFKVIYSKTRHCYVVVSELAKSHCKTAGSHTARNKTALTAAVLLALGAFSFAGMPVAQAGDSSAFNNDFMTANDTYWWWNSKENKWETYAYTLTSLFGNRARGDLPNYQGAGAKQPGAITGGLFAQAGMQTVTIGNRNAGQSMGSVFIGEHSGYDDKASNLPKGLGNNYVTSVGFQSDATGWGSIAIGSNATAENTKVHGTAANMTEDRANNIYEIEKNPTIEGASVALGYDAHSKDGNIAIGSYSDATAETTKNKTAYTDKAAATSYVSVGNTTTQRRITNVADGADATDVATVGQLQKAITDTGVNMKANIDASNIGNNIKVYKKDEKDNVQLDKNKKPIEDTEATKKTQQTNQNAWGAAIGNGVIANPEKDGKNDPTTNGSQQLVTGGTVYTALQNQKTDLTKDLSVSAGWGINIDKDKSTGSNQISLKRNLGKEGSLHYKDKWNVYDATVTVDDTCLILGGEFDVERLTHYRHANSDWGAKGTSSVIAGGSDNLANGRADAVFGGELNVATGSPTKSNPFIGWNTVSGGNNNLANGESAAVFGGAENKSTGWDTTVCGGTGNLAASDTVGAAVFGGSENISSSSWTVVSGGSNNEAMTPGSTVIGGVQNATINLIPSVTGGGGERGYNATVIGGIDNYASGFYSLALGGGGYQYGSDSDGNHYVHKGYYVRGDESVGIDGGSTGNKAAHSLAAGNQSVVTVANGTAIGYQSTADEEGTIAFGHDKGDISGYTVIWKQKATSANGKYYDANGTEITKDKYDALKNPDNTYNDYSKDPTITEDKHQTAAYNRLVKVADGKEDHDVVVMEQLKQYAEKDASNIGNNLTVAPIYKKDDNGKDVVDQKATEEAEKTARTANENAWGTAIGTGEVAKDNGQLVTGGKVYDALHGGLTDITIGKPGTAGKDGKDGEDGSIGLVGPKGENGKDGKTTTIIKTETGAAGVNGKDGKDGITRIYYYDQTNTSDKHTVATLDDGMKFGDDFGSTAAVKLDHQLDIVGDINAGKNDGDKKATKDDLSDGNIGVVATDTTYNEDGTVNTNGKMTIKLAKDLKGLHSSMYTTTETTGEGDKKQTTDYTTTIDSKGVTIQSKVTKDGNPETVNGPSMTIDGINGGGKKITDVGTGSVAKDSKDAVTGDQLYTEQKVRTDADNKLTNDLTAETQARTAADTAINNKIGTLDANGNYIQKDASVSSNLSTLDTQVKTNADAISKETKDREDAITNITNNIGDLSDSAVKYDADTNKSKVTLAGTDGTTITNLKDGALSASSTDAVTGKQLFAEQQARTEADTAINNKIGTLDANGNYIQKDASVSSNLSTLDTQVKTNADAVSKERIDREAADTAINNKIGTLDANGNYIQKDASVSSNLSTLDTQVKTNADAISKETKDREDAITNITNNIGDLSDSAVKYDADTNKSKVTLAGTDGTTITNLKDGALSASSTDAVTGKQLFAEQQARDAADTAINNKIGSLDANGNYIQKDASISSNLSTLDTQVKTNADNIEKNTRSIQDITNNMQNLSENAVKYDGSDKSKVSLGGKDGTVITNVKEGALSDSSTDAVNGKQLYNEQQAREKADAEINQKVTTNTDEITKIKNGNFTDASKTAIHNIAKDAVAVVNGKNTTFTKVEGTDTTPTTYAVNVEGTGKVASGDTGLISGDTLYKEVHIDKDGAYIKGSNTVGQNLSNLDTGLKTTSDLIHTNTKGDTIQIGGNSTATKIDVSGKDANGNTTGRVITGVVSDASDPNSAANVGYVNGLTAANTQQIYRDMNNAYSRLDTNINRAAAGSNALAALHPLDFDPADKASFAVGYGHYHNANAAAVGAFYQPNANTMVNMGISLGNGDPGFNAGVSFKIGKGSAYNGVSKAEMAQTIHDQAAEISTIKANDAAKDKRIDALEKENQEMKKQIQEILARLNG